MQERKSKIGNAIRALRTESNLSLRALSEKSGVPWNTIARIERGETDPRSSTVCRILDSLNDNNEKQLKEMLVHITE